MKDKIKIGKYITVNLRRAFRCLGIFLILIIVGTHWATAFVIPFIIDICRILNLPSGE